MKINKDKLFNWQNLLAAAQSATSGLLPLAKVEACDEPKVQMAEFVRHSVMLAASAGLAMPIAGGRFAYAAAVDGCTPRADASAFAKLLPNALACRKEAPGLHAASPESTGQGAAAPANLHAPNTSSSIGSQKGQEQKQPTGAARIAMLRQHTLEEFDDLDSYAEELGDEPLSDAAKANAWKLALSILDISPDYYCVSPDLESSVSICFSKRKMHHCTIMCNADGSVTCFVALDGNANYKKYASIDGLPDDYMREALAPPPYAGSR